ncbi:DUF3634 family protein [Motilimonas cestriensis]|uniref:DUF3634 family protein n=1 Tax=Motilimonas cestriensis TaxID=2742685 RepID=UPI003DA40583
MLLRITAPIWVNVKNGQIIAKRGLFPAYFQTEIERIFNGQTQISGDIFAVKSGKHYKLSFSKNIPEGYQQRCRNVWRGYAPIKSSSGNLKKV